MPQGSEFMHRPSHKTRRLAGQTSAEMHPTEGRSFARRLWPCIVANELPNGKGYEHLAEMGGLIKTKGAGSHGIRIENQAGMSRARLDISGSIIVKGVGSIGVLIEDQTGGIAQFEISDRIEAKQGAEAPVRNPYLQGVLNFSYSIHDNYRRVLEGPGIAKGEYKSWALSPSLTLGRDFRLNSEFSLEPSVDLRYSVGFYDDYREKVLKQKQDALSIGNRTQQSLLGRLNLAGVYQLPDEVGRVALRFGLSHRRHFASDLKGRLGDKAFTFNSAGSDTVNLMQAGLDVAVNVTDALSVGQSTLGIRHQPGRCQQPRQPCTAVCGVTVLAVGSLVSFSVRPLQCRGLKAGAGNNPRPNKPLHR